MRTIHVITVDGSPVFACTSKGNAIDWVSGYNKINKGKGNPRISTVSLHDHTKTQTSTLNPPTNE